LVNPQFNLKKARKTASNYQKKLRNAKIFEKFSKSIKDLDYVVGTKPKKGISLKKFKPRKNTSIAIGRESSGLTNQELRQCDSIIHINTPAADSLNQANATAIIMYEMRKNEQGKSLTKKQNRVLEKEIGGTLKNIIKRANPSQKEYNSLMGDIKELKND
ncbi:MAG: TrmH family RNA methyltransferase, partial [Candidatus Nanohaloarchaea archaeon]